MSKVYEFRLCVANQNGTLVLFPRKQQREDLHIQAFDCADVTITYNGKSETFRRMFRVQGPRGELFLSIPYQVTDRLGLHGGALIQATFVVLTHIPREEA